MLALRLHHLRDRPDRPTYLPSHSSFDRDSIVSVGVEIIKGADRENELDAREKE